jgi:hypothetical protein
MEASGQLHAPVALPPGTHWIGDWVDPRAVLDAVVKRKIPRPRRELNPRTPIVQPVAQRYTDWAVTVLIIQIILLVSPNSGQGMFHSGGPKDFLPYIVFL